LHSSSIERLRHARAAVRRTAVAVASAAVLFGTLVPAVSAADGLEVTTAYPAVAVAPGSKVTFDLTVASARNATIALAVAGVPQGWTASLHGGGFVVDGVAAGPGKDGSVRLDVDVPGTATASTETLRVTASGGGAEDVLPISIRVDTQAAGGVTVDTPTPTRTGSSNDTFTFALTVHNDTAQDVTVSATAAVPDQPDWTVTAEIAGQEQAASTVVAAGSTTSINVTAKPPENAPAGQYLVHVEVKAGEQTIPADLGVELTGSYSMTLETSNQALSASGSAGSATAVQFVVTNTGTAPLTALTLAETAPTNWTVTFAPTAMEPVAPGATGTFTATITPASEAVSGDYQVSITASNDQATETAAIRFTVETSPIWAIIGLLVIAAVIGGLFFVFRTYGRR
jgi:uncharacterized membrane protein